MGRKDGFSRSELLQFSPSSATLRPLLPFLLLLLWHPIFPKAPSFIALLEVSLCTGFPSHQPPSSPPSPRPHPLPSISATNTSYFYTRPLSGTSPSTSPLPPQQTTPRLSLGPLTKLFNPFSYLPRKLLFKLPSSTSQLPGILFPNCSSSSQRLVFKCYSSTTRIFQIVPYFPPSILKYFSPPGPDSTPLFSRLSLRPQMKLDHSPDCLFLPTTLSITAPSSLSPTT